MSEGHLPAEQIILHLLAKDSEQNDDKFVTDESFDRRSVSRTRLYLITITIGLAGLQGVFAIQFSYGSPYLHSLGLSKPLMGLVWVAGPLAGVLVQPYVGICSDQSRHRWGKRRPYIALGGAATILSLLGLAWVKEIVGACLQPFATGSNFTLTTTKILAVVLVYLLNTAVQPIQGGIRALMVDKCPRNQQSEVNAWAGRLIEIGNIVIYLSAYTPLQRLFPFFDDAQFKILCVIVSIGLVITLSITCLAITERSSQEDEKTTRSKNTLERLRRIKKIINESPAGINRVLQIQFFSWMGWFPFLYYITTLIGQKFIDQQSRLDKASPVIKGHEGSTLSEATRIGSLSLLLHAAISLLVGFIVPLIVQETTINTPISFGILEKNLGLHRPTLRNVWFMSHFLFGICLLSVSFVDSLTITILIVGFMGINRAITAWAPHALLAAELSRADGEGNRGNTSNAHAGIVLGVHNMAISLPQIISAFLSSGIFWLVRTCQGNSANGGLEWILRISALPTFVAAFLTTRLDEGMAESGSVTLRSSIPMENALLLS